MNTPAFLNQYTDWGLKTVITNSYVYYMTETGIFRSLDFRRLYLNPFLSVRKGKSAVKWGLFVFIVVFQFMGGYLTNGLNWVAYGIILSNFNERNYYKSIEFKSLQTETHADQTNCLRKIALFEFT